MLHKQKAFSEMVTPLGLAQITDSWKKWWKNFDLLNCKFDWELAKCYLRQSGEIR